jgi:FKBP-type peptidyl-prolyl cis-trans isomerase SlpA
MTKIEQLTIGAGSVVTMYFCLRMKSGIVADSTEPNEPMTFTMGDGSLVHGLEMSLLGLKTGDKQTVEIDPLNAFGFSDPENVYDMPREEFAADLPLDPGTIMSFSTPSGDEIPGVIKEFNESTVKVDFNHPLAGQDVIFEVEILDVKPPGGDA